MKDKDSKVLEEAYEQINEEPKTLPGVIAGSEDGAALADTIRSPQDPKKLHFMRSSIISKLNKINNYETLRDILLAIKEMGA